MEHAQVYLSTRQLFTAKQMKQYTPALDITLTVDEMQAAPASVTLFPTPSTIPPQLPIATPIQPLSSTPTHSQTSTPSPDQTLSTSSSPSTSPTSNSSSLVECASTSQFPTLQLLSSMVAIAIILVIVVIVTKKKQLQYG